MSLLNPDNEKVAGNEKDDDVENEEEEEETVERDAMNLLKKQSKKLIMEERNLLCFLSIHYLPMGRRCHRHICGKPDVLIFKPAGIQRNNLEEIVLKLDEYEALRLVDIENLTMQAGAEKMKISSATFNRLVQSVHSKIANAIVFGKVIRINKEYE